MMKAHPTSLSSSFSYYYYAPLSSRMSPKDAQRWWCRSWTVRFLVAVLVGTSVLIVTLDYGSFGGSRKGSSIRASATSNNELVGSNNDKSSLRWSTAGRTGSSSSSSSSSGISPDPGAETATEIVWIMSFGGSGTSYTITNIEAVTGTNTGTNYASDIVPNVPILPQYPLGPFIHAPHRLESDRPMPPHYIVAKTHCGAYCMNCGPREYFNVSVDAFAVQCRTAQVSTTPPVSPAIAAALAGHSAASSSHQIVYADTPIAKIVHVIRSPFANLVGRMHLASKHREARGEDVPWDAHTAEGYAQWCHYLDHAFADEEKAFGIVLDNSSMSSTASSGGSSSSRIVKDGDDDEEKSESHPPDWHFDANLPCRAEWYRYVQWHNRALDVIQRTIEGENQRVHTLYYEDYDTDQYNTTLTSLLQFVELSWKHAPLPFYSGKTYLDYFSIDHQHRARAYVKRMASPEAWDHLKRYFDDFGTNIDADP